MLTWRPRGATRWVLCVLLTGCARSNDSEPTQDRDDTPSVDDGTEVPRRLTREDCDGSVEYFAWCEGASTFVCSCRNGAPCTVFNTTCPWLQNPRPTDTGLFCCIECSGITNNQVSLEICT